MLKLFTLLSAVPAVLGHGHHHHHHSRELSGDSPKRSCGTQDASPREQQRSIEVVTKWRSRETLTGSGKAATKTVKVYWHNVNAEVSVSKVQDSIDVLNAAFSPDFQFTLESTDSKKFWWWFGRGLDIDGFKEKRMKSVLREGDYADLNVYAAPLTNNLLGWATFPAETTVKVKTMDGVVIGDQTVPGGTAAPYNEGDTLTHEVGHWLGLYHVFQGGCAGGDSVDDTPPQSTPSFQCPIGKNSCDNYPGLDSVDNFMDYSDDSCMDKFTAGQRERANALWDEFRDGK